jgi:chaperonin GroEL
LAKLAGGVAVINVGATTETEMKEKKARVEDALPRDPGRRRKGIVPGGGVALLRTMKALSALKLEGDEAVGAQIIKKLWKKPIRMIAENGGVEGSIVIDKVLAKDGNFGYNAETDEYGDMMKFGVIDPTKVTRTALENAASIASLLLTTEAIITEKPEEKKPMPGMPPGGGMGDMY